MTSPMTTLDELLVKQLRRYADPEDLIVGPNMIRDALISAADALEAAAKENERMAGALRTIAERSIETPTGHGLAAYARNALSGGHHERTGEATDV